MKYLVFLPQPFWIGSFGLTIDAVAKLATQGHEVFAVVCDNPFKTCNANLNAHSMTCMGCHFIQGTYLKKLPQSVRICRTTEIVGREISRELKAFNPAYSSVDEIKEIRYKGIEIGRGALSTYITFSRNLNPRLDERFRRFFANILNSSCIQIEAIQNGMKIFSPDCVVVYNGRFSDSRPIYNYCIQNNIQVLCYEANGGYGETPRTRIEYIDSLPHSIAKNTELIQKCWVDSPSAENVKLQIGKDFFSRRRNGLEAGDKAHSASQHLGLLPRNWDPSLRNTVIFNSSEDEFASIGGEFESLALFKSQIEGIRYILNALQTDETFHFYLRIHPNLRHIKYKYHTDLHLLENEFENLTVIKADERISSYTLIDAAEKVVVFGSTIGVEAAYWGKPVILLGAALYYNLDTCYIPKTKLEIKPLLLETLRPKDSNQAAKYGFFVISEWGERPTLFDFSPEKKMILKKMQTTARYVKTSSILITKLIRFLAKILDKLVGEVPKDEA